MKPLSSSDFNETIATSVTLVDFYATWCGPCKRLAPALEGLAAGMDNATIGKVDVDKEPGLASKYGINRYPTMILFKDGEEVGRLIGTHSAEQIQAFINQA